MKKLFILLLLLLPFACMGQNIVRNGKNYTKVSKTATKEVKTDYTYTVKDATYPIYIGKTGSCYIKRVSKNGNTYKQYLGEDISREICKETGVKYKPKSKTNKGED